MFSTRSTTYELRVRLWQAGPTASTSLTAWFAKHQQLIQSLIADFKATELTLTRYESIAGAPS